jgi:hypothetical protein
MDGVEVYSHFGREGREEGNKGRREGNPEKERGKREIVRIPGASRVTSHQSRITNFPSSLIPPSLPFPYFSGSTNA